jgi:hypothetical protein
MGGEPVMAEDDLSPEEMAELESVLEMAEGGYVRGFSNGGDTLNPLGDSWDKQAAKDYFGNLGTQPQTDWRQFSTPGSYAGGSGQVATTQAETAATPAAFIEYIGPNGQIMMIPVDANGKPTISVPEGYTKKEAQTAKATVDQSDDHMKNQGNVHQANQVRVQQANQDWFDKFHNAEDAVGMAEGLLEKTPGDLGGVVGGADTLGDIARIRGYAAAIAETNPELSDKLYASVDEAVRNAGWGVQALQGLFAQGKGFADTYSEFLKTNAEGTAEAPVRPQVGNNMPSVNMYDNTTAAQRSSFEDKNRQAEELSRQQQQQRSSNDDKPDSIHGHTAAIDRHRADMDSAMSQGHSAGVAGSAASRNVTSGLTSTERLGGAELDRAYGISGLAKGGLVTPKPTKKKKKAPKGKRGLGRK